MAVIFHDTFNRANASTLGTADTGQTWSSDGDRGISGNKAYTNGGFGGTGVSLSLTLPYVSQATFSNIAAGENPNFIFWRQDSTVSVGVRATTSGYTIYAFNFDDGFITYATSSTTPANGDVITVSVDASKVATVYLNGTASGNIIMTWTVNVKYTALDGVGLGGSGTVSLFDEIYVANSLSDLSAAPNVYNSSCSMQGVATISATSVLKQFSSVTAQGVGGMTATGTKIVRSSADIQGVSDMSAVSKLVQSSSTSMTGVSSLAAASILIMSSSSVMNGVSLMTAAASLLYSSSTTMQGVAQMTASDGGMYLSSVTMQGVSSLAAVSSFTNASSASMTGVSSLSSNSVLTTRSSVSMGGVAGLIASAMSVFKSGVTMQGAARFSILTGSAILRRTSIAGSKRVIERALITGSDTERTELQGSAKAPTQRAHIGGEL